MLDARANTTTTGNSIPETIQKWARTIFPPSVKHCIRQINPNFDRVSSTQPPQKSTGRTKRQIEFNAGRNCAQQLLREWEHHGNVGVDKDRTPIWPAGFTGSISHSDDWVWVAIAKLNENSNSESTGACGKPVIRAIGIDTELIVTPATPQQLKHEIASDREWQIMDSLGNDCETTFTLAFSAKEAFYKCWFPITRQFFGFDQAAITQVTNDTICVSSLPDNPNANHRPNSLLVSYVVEQGQVFTATWMESER